MKLTTTVFGRYGMYKSTRLNYNNADNPHPDYWKNLPSSYFYVWGDDPLYSAYRTESAANNWKQAYDSWQNPINQQINWNQLYYANSQVSKNGADALYFIQAKNIDNATLTLASTLAAKQSKNASWNVGLVLSTNNGHHYQTMEDLLGAKSYHNINTYAVGKYAPGSDETQYDLNSAGPNNLGRLVYNGDIFGYNYNIFVHKANVWANYQKSVGRLHMMVAGRLGGVMMRREGHMRNGLFANNSYGKGEYARFGEGGVKGSLTYNAGNGHTFLVGMGYQWNAPKANAAFASPEMNNDFVLNLKDEHVLTSEIGYQVNNSWLHANINAYYNRMDHVSEWQNFYFDDINSFSYVSMTGIKKEFYGVEAGLKFKLSSAFDINMLGTVSEAKNINNAQARYLISTEGAYSETETVYNKDMHEASTPLTALSLGLSYHQKGWFIDLNGNYYDRIYLSYSPCYRYESSLKKRQNIYGDVYDNEGNLRKSAVSQEQGKGGFMLDGSVGRLIRLKKGQISINFSITNILNNRDIVTGGFEQSRSDYSNEKVRAYRFSKNPKKFYAFGPNGLLNIAYKF